MNRGKIVEQGVTDDVLGAPAILMQSPCRRTRASS